MKDHRPGLIAPMLVVVLSIAGLIASVYLLDVFYQVRLGEASGDSFCTVSETVNCEKVAASEYSLFLGVPLALWGILFYVYLLLCVAGRFIWRAEVATPAGSAGAGRVPWKDLRFSWDAAMVWPVALVFFDDIYLAWTQFSCIGSICIVCFITYALNFLLLVTLLASRRFALGELTREAWGNLRYIVATPTRVVILMPLVVLGVAVLSYLWVHPMGSVELGAPQGAPPAASGEPVRGPADAPVQIVGITDFECPFCSRAAHAVEQVLRNPAYEGKIRFEHVDYPLDNACNPNIKKPFHEQACQAAYASRCAGAQDAYWAFHHKLFEHQKSLSPDTYLSLARELGLDLERFRACFADADGSLKARILTDIARARGYKIRGTPTFIVNGVPHAGFLPPARWEAIIDDILAGKAPADAGRAAKTAG